MSNVIAGVVRGQFPYLDKHIQAKRAIYERYRDGFQGLPLRMNPYDEIKSKPNFWLSCVLIEQDAMCRQVRSEREALYIHETGKSCPTEILERLAACNAEGRPIWKPMHMQPLYRMNGFITCEGNGRAMTDAYTKETVINDVGADIFTRGLCLPSDVKMSKEQQEKVISIVRSCFE